MGTYISGMGLGFLLGVWTLGITVAYVDIAAKDYIARYTQGEEVCQTFGGLESLDKKSYTCKDTTNIKRKVDYEQTR